MFPTFKPMRRALALMLTALIFSSTFLPAFCCSPDYQHAVLFSWNHPDLPLSGFASGKLGVIQRNWARSYLCVAYRYLSEKPLDKGSQLSALQLWHQRIYSQGSYLFDSDYYPSLNYDELRLKILKTKPGGDLYGIGGTAQQFDITDSAYALALTTLRQLVKQYGSTSSQARDWARAQDGVFGYNKDKKVIAPGPLSQSSSSELKTLRLYQIAAAHFYQRSYKQAAIEFAKLAGNKSFSLASMSEYLSERALVGYSMGAGAEINDVKEMQELQKKAAACSDYQRKIDYLALAGIIFTNSLSPQENAARILKAVSKLSPALGVKQDPIAAIAEGSDAFGRNLGDLTYWMSLSESPITKEVTAANDMVDWVATVYDGYDCYFDPRYLSAEEKQKYDSAQSASAKKALSTWSQKPTLPWLVAVMLTGSLRGAQRAEARAQAEQITPTSPAYLTARFYLIDALIAEGKCGEAREKLRQLDLTDCYKQAPPTAVNLFATQRLSLATTTKGYLNAAALHLSAVSSNSMLVPDKWPEPSQRDNYKPPSMDALDSEIADDVDGELPYSLWLDWSKDKTMAANLRGRIVCATWIRAVMLHKDSDLPQLTREMAGCYPVAQAKLKAFEQARGEARDYLFAQICLDNYGFSPYVGAGLPRMGDSFNTFNYYANNYWRTLPAVPQPKKAEVDQCDNINWVADRANANLAQTLRGYYEQHKIGSVLSATQKFEARAERKAMGQCTAARLLSGAVVSYAKNHLQDPAKSPLKASADQEHSPAHYLYKAVKVPYWSGEYPEDSKYSRSAYEMLHQRYGQSKWAKKAICWY